MHFSTQNGFITSIPSLYQPWDLQHLHLPEFFTEAQRQWREARYRAFCDQAKVVVTATNWVKRDLEHEYGVPAERIAVVNVPPITAAYQEPSAYEMTAIAVRLSLPERFVFYPAQTWQHKNHERLFEALAVLRSQGMAVPLVCSGHLNDRYPQLVSAARRLDIDADVRFLGYLDPIEVMVLYRRAHALVFPSLYEGWGLPIMEAFASDLPVACSNVTSLPELVGDAALLFNPYDVREIATAVSRLWTDDALASELARRGRARVGSYDWHRTALTMRAHYRQVAGRTLEECDRALLTTPPEV
jgi:glycosyltransferase involved in cell wall biosynthesis